MNRVLPGQAEEDGTKQVCARTWGRHDVRYSEDDERQRA